MQENEYTEPAPVICEKDNRTAGRDRTRGIYAERRSFDRLLVPLSSRCMNAPLDQLDEAIEKGLKEVNSFFGGDRVLLWEFSEDGYETHVTHSHAEPGAEPPASAQLQETLPYIFDKILGSQNLCVSHLGDLPQAAHLDKQYLERLGIRSFLLIPLLVGGTPRGALSLACIRTERAWSNEDLFNFQRIGGVLSSGLDRKRSHQLLERRMRFETLITDLSARIIKTPSGDVDGEIEWGLSRVGEFFQVDRCGLLSISQDKKMAWVTHAWYGKGIERVSGEINLAALFPWSYEKLIVQRSHVSTTRMKELPPEADTDRQSWNAMGVRSSLDIPVLFGDRISHVVVIQDMREEHLWPEVSRGCA
jgi:GAF domain-containing protein